MQKQIDNITFWSACHTYSTFPAYEIPASPWQKVSVDIFQVKYESYLLIVNYYPKFLAIVNLSYNLGCENVI